MKVVLHAGVHATDEDRLVKCLLKNKETLLARGTAVPGPSRYRRALRDAMQDLLKAPPTPESRVDLLAQILEQDPVERLLLSNENFFCVPKLALSGGVFYERAEHRMADFCALFAGDAVQLSLGICNPATYLPGVFKAAPDTDFAAFLGGVEPTSLRWSELITRLRTALPDLPITLWCNEDTPLIWGEVLRRTADLPEDAPIAGAHDILREIMTREGMTRFRAYLDDHPTMSEGQKRRAIMAFLDKFAIEDVIEQEVTLPGWDDALIEDLTGIYEDDLALIQSLPGVTVITP